MKKRKELEDEILDMCQAAGCSTKAMAIHRDAYINGRWHPHPPRSFVDWWEPNEFDEKTGASKGGHPDAYRLWSRPEPDGSWTRRRYGIHTVSAYNSDYYFKRHLAWLLAGAPKRPEPFVSISASFPRQKEFWAGLKSTIAKIAKPMQ